MSGVEREQPPLPAPDHDSDRLTIALLTDIKAVLERHGYRLPADTTARHRAIAETLAALGHLVNAFEGHTPQADAGHLADGTPLTDLPEEET